MTAFIDAPPVVLAPSHQVSCFPKVLPVIADPDLTAHLVYRQPPGVPQSVGPLFWSRFFQTDEWIVLGHRVRSRSIRMINVNTKYAAVQCRQVLSCDPVVR